MLKLNAKELRASGSAQNKKDLIKKTPIYIIVDNVLDTYNIGAIFRLADAVAVEKVFLCGMTETPPNSRIKKASINTTEWVEWGYYSSAVEAVNELRHTVPGIKIYSVEQNKNSQPYNSIQYNYPLALIVGHETDGVTHEAINLSDEILEIPMRGVNKSLNVMVSLAIVLYQVLDKTFD
jgi:tRNA G18 (ribose-2'-O)-methylase SpoU